MARAIGDPRCAHAQAIKKFVTPTPQNISFFNNLITLYSKFNLHSSALLLFHSIPSPNTVTWTSIISASASASPLSCFRLFLSMLRHPLRPRPNSHTLSTLLKASASLSDHPIAPQLQSLSLKLSFHRHPFVASAFVSLYCKTRDVDSALKVFDEMPHRDEVCYAALINGLARAERPLDALRCFVEMKREGVASTCHSVSGAISAASRVAMLEQCLIMHCHALVAGFDSHVYVATALIDGYGKCGVVEEARVVFDEMGTEVNLVGWNAMMAGYAQQGSHEHAVELFGLMESRGIEADVFSFLAILTAFYNAGMVEEIEIWLNRMKLEYGLEPLIEHYTCLVGAMGKAGRLEEAERVALTMPDKPDAALWRVLLSICADQRNPRVARRMSEKLLEINPNDDSAYVILANAFAGAEEAKKVWTMMRDNGVRKEAGNSWIEVRGRTHVFFAGRDVRHPRKDEIEAKLAELISESERLGYALSEDDERKEMLWFHSEKLAVAFGLLSGVTPEGKAVRIVKNLRICRDCHEFFKCISRVRKREIIVRDAHRYHRFVNGTCNCGDSW
ncbi:pentatricopeptide repeat-containing protein At2g03880, mitochondrial-like [Salvia hispanica]|uniref:pentatricopeptide repeat-containing protein At2g03880, mitochondrial-like n=1 Tax=Salvia hispanica TaxID=49212 RepID=UPI0020097805|nr:pentatricopeptide repeat-containing protein At2g03880, mitochondrial-like [Salvia hispanica]